MRKPDHTWDDEIKQLHEFFDGRVLPETVRINSWSMIVNTKLFVATHFSMVHHHNGKEVYSSYLERLKELREILKSQKP